ncbi:MAG TPA: hypothetical protein PLS28_02805 [Clostridiales bacterium]|nr:hypothetical protein [Clostridiales bacterium]
MQEAEVPLGKGWTIEHAVFAKRNKKRQKPCVKNAGLFFCILLIYFSRFRLTGLCQAVSEIFAY